MSYHVGQLLVATPRLVDPNFARAVILLLDHDEDGALGVVINRPSQLPLSTVLPTLGLGGHRAVDAVQRRTGRAGVRVGCRAVAGRGARRGLQAADRRRSVWSTSTPTRCSCSPTWSGVRVFSGYAGWGAGQLEAEMVEGSWYLAEALPNDLLDPDPERLWRSVLRRQAGELAYVATFPDDPAMN